MLQVINIILMHMHQLKTIYQCYGVKCQSGSFGVTKVKRSNLPKLLPLLHITCYGHVTHVCEASLTLYTSCAPIVGQGSNEVTGSKGQIYQICYKSSILRTMIVILMHMRHATLWGQRSIKGERVNKGSNEVTGLKR